MVLQHRASWSHHGDTWGFPGGAIRADEDAITGALRESAEEAGIPADRVTVRATSVLRHPDWCYTTVLGRIDAGLAVRATDRESLAIEWVGIDDVERLPLLPAFAQAWPMLRVMLITDVVVLVDAANVVGSRPDGWWHDRAGANTRLVATLDRRAPDGVPATVLDRAGDLCWPTWTVVTEGQARTVGGTSRVEVHGAPGSGDDTLVELTAQLAGSADVVVVTADRQLRQRIHRAGGRSISPGPFRDWLES